MWFNDLRVALLQHVPDHCFRVDLGWLVRLGWLSAIQGAFFFRVTMEPGTLARYSRQRECLVFFWLRLDVDHFHDSTFRIRDTMGLSYPCVWSSDLHYRRLSPYFTSPRRGFVLFEFHPSIKWRPSSCGISDSYCERCLMQGFIDFQVHSILMWIDEQLHVVTRYMPMHAFTLIPEAHLKY